MPHLGMPNAMISDVKVAFRKTKGLNQTMGSIKKMKTNVMSC